MLLGNSDKTAGAIDPACSQDGVPAAITDTGCERELNEDRYAVIESPSGLAWVVCDGMGGVSGGELAAQLAIDSIRRDLENLPARPLESALRSAIQEANRIVVLRRQNQAFAQMGTTVVGVIFNGPEVVIGHVGDSRAYLIRGGAIQQLTVDHTYVQELVEKGQIKPEEALDHPQAHILTRAIGSSAVLDLDISRLWVWDTATDDEASDKILLCTDGLYSLVSEEEVGGIVSAESPQGACAKLVELAKSRGGFDNITIAILPLSGQLRLEPPPGFRARQTRKKAAAARREAAPMSFWKIFLAVTVFSVIAVSLVILAIALKLNSN